MLRAAMFRGNPGSPLFQLGSQRSRRGPLSAAGLPFGLTQSRIDKGANWILDVHLAAGRLAGRLRSSEKGSEGLQPGLLISRQRQAGSCDRLQNLQIVFAQLWGEIQPA